MADPFIGEIRMFAGNYQPQGWAFCDGRLMSINENQALYSLLGTNYGGDGVSTFGLPDMRGRVPLHYGHGNGLSIRTLGQKFGTEYETLTIEQMPSHEHQLMANNAPTSNTNSPANMVLAKSPAEFQNFTTDITTSSTLSSSALSSSGNNQPHVNVMPAQALSFIISLSGIFPMHS